MAKTKKRTAATTAAGAGFRARVRMYRHGLGDCHLIELPRSDDLGRSYFIMIDCGVILGTPNPALRMTNVVNDIVEKTSGHVDLLIVTHEHGDHVSGFIQANAAFQNLKVGEIWFAWTEDPDDPLARKLGAAKEESLKALRFAAGRQSLAGDAGVDELANLLEFFQVGKGTSTRDAMQAARDLNPEGVRYRRPTDPPVTPDFLNGVRLFVMGPPQDERLLKRTNPSKVNHEGYGLALANFMDQVGPALTGGQDGPFDPIHVIPTKIAAEMDFFKSRYWEAGQSGNGWRRIDDTSFEAAAQFALQLDSLTNNTSLVLAIELAGGDVLLFAADAQVGNWLSWQDLTWTVDGETVTGPDLLSRTILLKVGHHGSHNATLSEKGLDLMKKLRFGLIPVDHATAVRKRWNRMPLPEIVAELDRRTSGNVFQSDMPDDRKVPDNVTATPLYFEVAV